MNKLRPVRIFWQNGVRFRQIMHVVDTVKHVLKILNLQNKMFVELGNTLCPIKYLDSDKKSLFFGKYNVSKMIEDISFEQFFGDYREFYTLVLMRDKLFMCTDDGKKEVGGVASRTEGAVVCVDTDDITVEMSEHQKYNIFSLVMHEIGHVFGLISDQRQGGVVLSSINRARHCANKCVMYPGWDNNLSSDSFCPTCLQEMKEYFEHY